MRSPAMLRRVGTSVVAGAVLVTAGTAAIMIPALASHTAPNGAVRTGPDLVFLDCVTPVRTTTQADPAPATDTAGRNAQSAATGSGCTVQAGTASSGRTGNYVLRARFTVDAIGVGGRLIRFSIPTTTPQTATLHSPTPPGPPGTAPGSTTPGTTSTTQFCTTRTSTQGEPGTCEVSVNSTAPGVVTVTGQERDSGESATENVEFRNNDTQIGRADETNRVVVKPAEDDYTGFNCEGANGEPPYVGTGGSPGTMTSTQPGNGCPSDAASGGPSTRAPSGTPARPVQVTYQLLDEGTPSSQEQLQEAISPTARPPRALANRTVTLTVENPNMFFTFNCGAVTFASGSTAPNAPDYRQCQFRNGPNAGAVAGYLVNRGQTIFATSDDNGLITVTIAVEKDANLDSDGTSNTTVTINKTAPATAGDNTNIPASETTTSTMTTSTAPCSGAECPTAPINFNTRNRPLTGLRINIECITGDPLCGGTVLATTTDSLPSPQPAPSAPASGFSRTFRPLTATTDQMDRPVNSRIRIGVFLHDQFLNLVRVPETDVSISASGAGFIRRECTTASTTTFRGSLCTNPAAPNTNFGAPGGPNTTPSGSAANPAQGSQAPDRTTGSYRNAVTGAEQYRTQDPFEVTWTSTGPIVVTATWQAPLTTFNGGGTAPAATGAPTTSAPSPTTASPNPTTASPNPTTASPNPTQPPQRFASRVVLVSSHSRVTAGNGPLLSGQVFDQNGAPLGGVNITISQKSFGETLYSQTPRGQLTSGSDGRFSLVVNPTRQTSYGANTDDGRANSNIVQIRVNARMDITSPAPNSLVSNRVTLSGRILPAYNNRLIGLRYLTPSGSFPFVGQSPTSNGVFTVRSGRDFPPGTYTFIVYMSPTQGTEYGSRSIRLTVR